MKAVSAGVGIDILINAFSVFLSRRASDGSFFFKTGKIPVNRTQTYFFILQSIVNLLCRILSVRIALKKPHKEPSLLRHIFSHIYDQAFRYYSKFANHSQIIISRGTSFVKILRIILEIILINIFYNTDLFFYIIAILSDLGSYKTTFFAAFLSQKQGCNISYNWKQI